MSNNTKRISPEDMMKLLDSCYEKAMHGIPHVSPSVAEMAEDYLRRNTPPAAARAMINNQVKMCHVRFYHRLRRPHHTAGIHSGQHR